MLLCCVAFVLYFLCAVAKTLLLLNLSPNAYKSGDNTPEHNKGAWPNGGGSGKRVNQGFRLVSHKLPQNNPNYQQNAHKHKYTWANTHTFVEGRSSSINNKYFAFSRDTERAKKGTEPCLLLLAAKSCCPLLSLTRSLCHTAAHVHLHFCFTSPTTRLQMEKNQKRTV